MCNNKIEAILRCMRFGLALYQTKSDFFAEVGLVAVRISLRAMAITIKVSEPSP